MIDVLFRWLHVGAAAIVVGGFVYDRFVLAPAMEALAEADRVKLRAQLVERLRPIALTSIVVIILSGSYNFYLAVSAGVDTVYHMAFGIKFLLALHVFGMLFVTTIPPSGDARKDAKRTRMVTGGAISGLIILLLGAYLKSLRL